MSLRNIRRGAAAAAYAIALAFTAPALAQSQRTFVSVSGVDNPSCSLAAPCRTFTAAVAATLAAGEVIVLTSGGYGAVTIAQSVSIIASPGVYAGISVAAGIGVDINLAASDSVTLRGLVINNVGSGSRGIKFTGSGRLQVENVHVSGFALECLVFSGSNGDLVVERSSFANCGWGVIVDSARALLDGISTHHNANNGVQVVDNASVVLRDSVASHNGNYGVWVYAQNNGNTGSVAVERSDLSHNTVGAQVGSFSGTGRLSLVDSTVARNASEGIVAADHGIVMIAGSQITRNGTGISYGGSGVARSQGNNLISGNGSDGTAPTIVGSK